MNSDMEEKLLKENREFFEAQNASIKEKINTIKTNVENGTFLYEENGVSLLRTGTKRTVKQIADAQSKKRAQLLAAS